MNKDQLKSYLEKLIELEKDRFMTKELISKIDSHKVEPILKSYWEEIEERPVIYEDGFSFKHPISIACGAICAILSMVIMGIFDIVVPPVPIVCYFLGAFFLGKLVYSVMYKEKIEEINERKRKAERIAAQRKKQQKDANIRIKKENQEAERIADEKNYILNQVSWKLKNIYSQLEQKLKELYLNDIIYPKYRNIISLLCFYEYIDSGRCSTLEGADGAYNLFEFEQRMNKISIQLDTIISSLNEIMNIHYQLYTVFNQINTRLTEMDEKLKTIVGEVESIGREAANAKMLAFAAAYHSNVLGDNSK
ncbi:MAG: hypothetical protein IJE46_02590 [Clostridia bacterium]|nr:hypothetical protein [Clostridia bacterium]